jgi:release factor glutamine methyltransferase
VSESLGAALRGGARRLAAAGMDTPDLDARLLLAEAACVAGDDILLHPEHLLGDGQAARFDALLERRLAGEPISRILGHREFWSLDFTLGPATLVPRPETETVVEAALAALPKAARSQPITIADLGTGSGAILLALLQELPNARGVGTDRSEAALRVARANANRFGLGARADFVACDFGAALRGGAFDLVVSNPPYIETAAIAALSIEVRAHEPRLALDGGVDGLDAYRSIAAELPRLLRPGGIAVLELGAGQERAVAGLLAERHLVPQLPARYDLAGCPRALMARVHSGGESQKSLGISKGTG